MTNPTTKERFINWITGMPISLFDATSSVFTKAGANATIGLVPIPGGSANSPAFALGDDSAWHSAGSLLGDAAKFAVVLNLGGSGATPSTGIAADIFIPWASTITRWTLLADQSGSIVIDIWNVAYASYPATVSNTITASALPTLSSATNNQNSTLIGWTTAVAAGSAMRFNVNSASTLTRVVMVLELTKTSP